jgi:endonuclease-3
MKEPNGWKTVYTRLKEFRATIEAPVDTIGCDKLFTEGSQPKTRRFQILVSLLLSSQTKDQVTAEAMRSLHAFAISEGYQVNYFIFHIHLYKYMCIHNA